MTLRQLIDNYDNDQGDVYRCYPKDDPILPWNVAGMSEEEWYDPDRSFARLEKYLISDEAFEVKWRDVYNRVFTNQTLEESIRNPLAGFQSHLFAKGFVGGYIFEEGKEHTDRRRHGFTDDVTGTCVKWTYGHKLATVHVEEVFQQRIGSQMPHVQQDIKVQ